MLKILAIGLAKTIENASFGKISKIPKNLKTKTK